MEILGMASIALLAAFVGTCFVVSVFFMFLGMIRERSIWHFLGLAICGIIVAVALQNLVGLYDWVELGLQFTNIGATTFLIGMIVVNIVMAWNFFATEGKSLIR